MKILDQFGIRQGEDLEHASLALQEQFPFGPHSRRAETLLGQISSVVLENVREVFASRRGMWNPGGFMVFPLGLLNDGCSVRLHVWPEGMERQTDQGPNPHNHALHLSSRIVLGQYSDVILKVQPLAEQLVQKSKALQQANVYGLYATHRNPGGRDILKTEGTLVTAIWGLPRELNEGETHHIEAGTYHISRIPKDRLTVTLVLDSPSFRGSSDVLLKSIAPEILRVRRNLGEAQLREAVDQVIAHVKCGDIIPNSSRCAD